MDDQRLTFLITGASRGLGQFLFQRLRDEGEDVVGTFHSSAADPVDANRMFRVDVADSRQVAEWVATLKPRLQKVVLVNCAGINYNSFAHKADLARWEQVVRVNLFGTFNVIHALLPGMRAAGYGRIINLSSVVAKTFVAGTSAYAASKAALGGMMRALVAENASKNITINNLDLGYFNIGIIREVPPGLKHSILAKIPSRALGEPDHVYAAVRMLVSNPYFNGACLDLNGGLA